MPITPAPAAPTGQSDARNAHLMRRLASAVRSAVEIAAEARDLQRAMDRRYRYIDS